MELAKLDLDQIDEELDESGYVVIRHPEIASICSAARAEYELCLQNSTVHAPRDSFDYRDLTKRPWRKLAIGSRNGLGHPYAQNIQSTYFDPNDQKFRALGRLFRAMIAVRNNLMRVGPGFGDEPERDRFWNACRVHHYPRGGGFMAMHKDTHFPKVIETQTG